MARSLLIVFFILLKTQVYAQFSFSTSTLPSTCSANGSITVNATGGTTPYFYQIVSSSNGIIRPIQTINVFNNLPAGSYTVRVDDKNSLTTSALVIVPGNYLPLSFTHTQQQSTIIINPQNGKPPYQYTYSLDGTTFLTPVDSNKFHCMQPGAYLFRIYDSCQNFYTENIVVYPTAIDANFSCVPVPANNTKSIILNSVTSGNGGYVFHAVGATYNDSNTTGNFYNINRCDKNVLVTVTDVCHVISPPYMVCPTPDFEFDIGCVNFKDRTVTITNIHSGNGLPYQYIANDVASSTPYIQNIPIPGATIFAGLIDSCGYKNVVEIKKMKVNHQLPYQCKSDVINLYSYYKINGVITNFPPTRYTSISGPTTFDVADSLNVPDDSSRVTVEGLQTGRYIYKVTNACGDEVRDTFDFVKRCFTSLSIVKFQTCTTLKFQLYKDCELSLNTQYTLKTSDGTVVSSNFTGLFSNLNPDSCYVMYAHERDCDTILTDNIYPAKPKLALVQNQCHELGFVQTLAPKKECGLAVIAKLFIPGDITITDSAYNILQVLSGSPTIMNVPPKTYYIYSKLPDCNSDTIRYVPKGGFTDTIHFCLYPTVKFINIHKCAFAWNVEMLDNKLNKNFTLTGNGVSLQSNLRFFGLDTGRYILSDGCNEQELYLPNLYQFRAQVDPGCPSNASITASALIDSNYTKQMEQKYFFKVCDYPLIDYNYKEAGTSDPVTYSPDGHMSNLKTGTYYAIFYKGNDDCNFFSDTVFTPFYTRPALRATYGLICNGNSAQVRATVTGGTPPYTYQVLNVVRPDIVTDSTSVIYTGLPLGSAQFRVFDKCGISTDYSTEVLSVDFQPTYKKKCNGEIQLIAPDIINTTYAWSNSHGDTIGRTPIVTTSINSDDTFTVTIHHMNCIISKSIFVPDFSASIVNAHAGNDFYSDTTFATLQANAPVAGAIGTWKQIDPSSGNTVFTDIHDPHTKTTIDVFPGQYTYVWSIADTAIGCVSEDTVVVSYLHCPNILPVRYSKSIIQPVCSAGGQINLTITQSPSTVHFFWNTGDTNAIIKNLKDSMYVVTISDETSCTADISDTTYLTGSSKTYGTTSVNLCEGDSVIIHNKKYFTSGNYTDTLVNKKGCDSILSITIAVFAKSRTLDTVTICNGQRHTLPNGQTITQAGDYSVKLRNSNGCDSTIQTHLIVHPTQRIIVDTTVCGSVNYVLPSGNIATRAGTYSDTLQNSFGCDSIIQTTISVRVLRSFVDTTICSGINYILPTGNSVTQAGIYFDTLQNRNGCDSIIQTTLHLRTLRFFVDTTICSGINYILPSGNIVTRAGIYSDTLQNSAGCDSIIQTTLHLRTLRSFVDTTICSGINYILPSGNIATRAGIYSDTLQNSAGCDSIIQTTLSIRVLRAFVDTMICSGVPYVLPSGNSVSQAGVYMDTIQNSVGCDSIVETTISVRDSLPSFDLGPDTTICVDDKLLLSVSLPAYVKFLWQDNSTASQFTVDSAGIYFVKAYDRCTQSSDTIKIKTKDCSCNFYIPDAFSPNGDNVNDYFAPINRCVFYKDYVFSIYDRYGQLLFRTSDVAQAWNGFYKDVAQLADSYAWTLDYFDELANEKVSRKGVVVLLR